MKVKRDGFGGHYKKRKDFSFSRYFNGVLAPLTTDDGVIIDPPSFQMSAHIIWNSMQNGTYCRKTEGEIGNRLKNIN